MKMNKTLTIFKITYAFGLFAGHSLKALDFAENCDKSDILGAIRVLEAAARNLRISDDEKIRNLGEKIHAEISSLVS